METIALLIGIYLLIYNIKLKEKTNTNKKEQEHGN
jgi:hypothetical protein